MSEWEERLQRQQMAMAKEAQQDASSDELDELSMAFIESMLEIRGEVESIKESNGTLFTALQNMLKEIMLKNTEALVQANNQFMHLIMRKIDELEERITSDEPAFTNVLYSDPELFNEISQREEEQEPSETKSDSDSEIPQSVVDGYVQYTEKQIKWSDFVKIAGGIKKAGQYKKLLSSSS
tara:strand:- start:182 stop:724 length:543 start_codon:yes stop_codon:yes gene_type:complete